MSALKPTRPLLAASVILNGVLAAALCLSWLLNTKPESEQPATARLMVETHGPQDQNLVHKEVSTKALAQPFHWRQLNSPDFATFVANLRGIGCPEWTIHDIVAGELNLVYQQKQQELALGAAPGQSAIRSAPSAKAAEIQRLESEKQQILANLLRVVEPAVAAVEPGSAAASSTQLAAAATKMGVEQIPAAFLVGNDTAETLARQELPQTITDPALPPETVTQLNAMRDQFATTLLKDNPNLDPNSKEYVRQWWKAKRESDDFFSSVHGGDALNTAYRQSMLNAAPAVK